jgi:5S rRNA maturation endonuclease (ribonuclease M5)
MLRRRQGLYEQGFAQVNSAYNFVNRGVTNPYSVQVRDTFLKQAKDNLKNLSALDLSQQQNVKAASSVFDPFVKNRAVLGDMALTAHWDQQTGIAESFRLKDGGKEFSQDNINYVTMQREAFAKDDISTVNDYYSNKRSYTPYYDWNKEVKDAMKEFKPSSTKMERINGMYMVTTKDASYTKEEINKYLSATLSDKAKQQMRIEAAVKFPDLNSVAGLYVNQAAQDLPQIEGRLANINNSIKTEKDTNQLEVLKKERDFYTDRAKEIRGNIQSIEQGDVSFLKKNAQRLAENIYIGQTVGRLADGFTHLDVEQTIGFNQVAMMYARMAFDREENEKTRNKDKELLPPVEIQKPGEVVETTFTSLTNKIESSEKEQRGKFAELKDVMVAIDPAFTGKTAANITEADVEKYVQTHPNSKEVRSFVDAGRALEVAKSQKENWSKDAEKFAQDQMGAEWPKYQKYLAEKQKVEASMAKPEVTFDPFKGTYIETRAAAPGQTPVVRDLGRVYQTPIAQDNTRIAPNFRMLTAPQQIAANTTGISLKEGMDLDNKYRKLKNEFNSKRNTVSSVFTPGITYSTADPRYKSAKGYLEAVTGLEGKVSGIGFYPSATDFSIEFKLDDANATNPIDRTKVRESLIARLGTNDVTYNEKTDMFSVGKIGPQAASSLDPYHNVEPLHRSILSGLDAYSGMAGSSRTGTTFNIGNTSTVFHISKIYGNTPQSNKYVLHAQGKPIQQTYGSALEAYSVAAGLANNPDALGYILNVK